MKQSLFQSTSGQRGEKKQTFLNPTKSKQKQRKQTQEEEEEEIRSPFQDLSKCCPRGCLRFYLNHSAKPTSNDRSSSRRKNNNNNQKHIPPFVKLNKPISSAKTPNKSNPTASKSSSRVSPLRSVGTHDVSSLKSDSNRARSNPNSTPLITTGGVSSSLNVAVVEGKGKNGSNISRLKSGSGDVEEFDSNRKARSDLNSTPLRTRTGDVWSGLNVTAIGDEGKCKDSSSSLKSSNSESSSIDTKTPPLHSTVSPEEIQQQCPSSSKSVTTTPVCYGAGHLLSGTPDKKKCRPRGLLVVGEDIVVDTFDIDDHYSGDLSPSAFPVKASMHWLHSPGKEDAEGSSSWNGAQYRCGLVRRAINKDCSPPLPSSSCSYNASSDMTDENTRRMVRSSCSQSPEFGINSADRTRELNLE